MSITKEQLKETLRNIMKEESDYQAFFKAALEKAGKSIPSMSDEEKKAFFNKIDAAWDGKGEKNEGNAFGAAVTAAKEAGEDEFEVDGKTYKVEEGKKAFRVNPGIGKSKYSISFHDGVSKHKDGSDFWGIEIFKNKVDLEKGIKNYTSKGFVQESVNEAASRTAMEIGGLTGMNKDAIQKFVDSNELDIEKVFQYVKKGKLKDRMDLVSAIAGKPGNPIQKKMISMFGESVNEEKYPIAIEKFNKELIKHPMVKKAAQHYKKTPTEIVKVLQQRLYSKGDKTGNTKEVWIDFKDTTSGITIKHKMKFNESVNEGVSPKDMDKIKSAVEAASSFMNIGSELKKTGLKYVFATSPMPIYVVQPTPNNRVAIVNKKYASKPDFVHGDTAVGVMESLTEGRAFINAAKKAKAEGKTEFEFNGKTYPVTIKENLTEARLGKVALLKQVEKGNTSQVEGVKISPDLAFELRMFLERPIMARSRTGIAIDNSQMKDALKMMVDAGIEKRLSGGVKAEFKKLIEKYK